MTESFEKLFSDFPEVTRQEWKDKIIKDLKGKKYEGLIQKTEYGSSFEPFYQKNDINNIPFIKNTPGEFPFLRSNSQDNNWIIRQDIIVDDTVEANKNAKNVINTGVNSVCFVLNERHISDISDLSILLEGIDICNIEISFKKQDDILQLQELFILYIKLNNIDIKKVKGSFNYNPFGDLLNNGSFSFNEDEILSKFSSFIDTNIERLSTYGAINIGADIFKDSGSTVIQEVAFALSQAVEYISKYAKGDINKVKNILQRMEFTFATSSDYFIEIAKYRAVRLLWANITKEFGVEDTELQKNKVNSVSAYWNKTVYDAHVNMLRVTTETMAAALGGCKSISVLPFDASFSTPNDFSYRIAKNTQIILKEESYFDKIVDPAGGSYYIEKLTDDIITKSWDLFLEIENNGGFFENIKNSKIQDMIEASANEKYMAIAQGKTSVLGTNKYPNQEEKALSKINFDYENTFDKEDADFNILHRHRGAEAFEKLRFNTEKAFIAPKVFLYNTGNVVMSKARAMFVSNFFACAGFEIIESDLSLTMENGIAELSKNKADIVVVCSSDNEYADVVPELKNKLDSDIKLVVAGYPKDLVDKFKEIGVTDFVHVKSNILETLTRFQNDILK